MNFCTVPHFHFHFCLSMQNHTNEIIFIWALWKWIDIFTNMNSTNTVYCPKTIMINEVIIRFATTYIFKTVYHLSFMSSQLFVSLSQFFLTNYEILQWFPPSPSVSFRSKILIFLLSFDVPWRSFPILLCYCTRASACKSLLEEL